MRVRELEGGRGGEAVGERDKGFLQDEAVALHGAQSGGVHGGAAQDFHRKDTEVFAPRYGQGIGQILAAFFFLILLIY